MWTFLPKMETNFPETRETRVRIGCLKTPIAYKVLTTTGDLEVFYI